MKHLLRLVTALGLLIVLMMPALAQERQLVFADQTEQLDRWNTALLANDTSRTIRTEELNPALADGAVTGADVNTLAAIEPAVNCETHWQMWRCTW